MEEITLQLESWVVLFYRRIANMTEQSVEQVLCDALLKLAGELSLEALQASGHHSTFIS